jgi:hypothetical protein
LKEKVDAGADLIITQVRAVPTLTATFRSYLSLILSAACARFFFLQMIFDAPVYKAFVDACRAHDILVPIVPGIMCIQVCSCSTSLGAAGPRSFPDVLGGASMPKFFYISCLAELWRV